MAMIKATIAIQNVHFVYSMSGTFVVGAEGLRAPRPYHGPRAVNMRRWVYAVALAAGKVFCDPHR